MTPNEELEARFLALSIRLDAARAKFMARRKPPAANASPAPKPDEETK